MVNCTIAVDDAAKTWCKVAQVCIDAGHTIGMAHIYGFAKTIGIDGNFHHVAFTYGIDGFAFHMLCLHVYATMEVVRTWLAEIACQCHLVMNGRGKDAVCTESHQAEAQGEQG